eukprot:583909-Hanusia_phi.AAC.1
MRNGIGNDSEGRKERGSSREEKGGGGRRREEEGGEAPAMVKMWTTPNVLLILPKGEATRETFLSP